MTINQINIIMEYFPGFWQANWSRKTFLDPLCHKILYFSFGPFKLFYHWGEIHHWIFQTRLSTYEVFSFCNVSLSFVFQTLCLAVCHQSCTTFVFTVGYWVQILCITKGILCFTFKHQHWFKYQNTR